MPRFLLRLWKRISEYGNEHHSNDEAIRLNIIINQALLLYVSLIFFTFLATAVISYYLLEHDAIKYGNYIFFYGGLEISTIGFLIACYFIKNALGKNLVFQIIVSLAGLLFLYALSRFTGPAAGVHFFMLTLLPIPFFFERSGRSKVILHLFIFGALIGLATWHVYQSPALYPLPEFANQIVFFLAAGLVSITIMITLVYVIWYFRLAGHIIHYWRIISEYGNDGISDPAERKFGTIANQFELFFVVIILFFVNPVIYLIREFYGANDPELQRAVSIYFIPFNIEVGVLLACYFLKPLFWRNFFTYFAHATGILVLALASLMLGKNSDFHYLILSLIPFPFFYTSKDKKYMIGVLSLFSVGVMAITLWLLERVPPLQPLTAEIDSLMHYLVIAGLILVSLACTYYFWSETRLTETQLVKEKEKADELLLNILPQSVADELKLKGEYQAVHFDSASVLFTDFIGFTQIAEKLTPTLLIEELDRCFSYFDAVMEKYGLEKLKTIGDAYMAVAGIPAATKTHAIDCTLAALEIQAFMKQVQEIKQAQGLPYWQLRLGICSGPLVAGVIGAKKFTYDVWGDTVNTAARMESSGLAGQINISKSTYLDIRKLFKCKFRGKVKAKNKGMIDMYLVERVKPKFSAGKEGRVPNDAFFAEYQKWA